MISSLTNYTIADNVNNISSREASPKLYRERNSAAHTNFDKKRRLIGFCEGGCGNMRDGLVGRIEGYPTAGNVYPLSPFVVVEDPGGWSAVSSSLEPSPPTGHYCLVPYSVTNCFIKLKSHNPHCTASRRPCRVDPSFYPPPESLLPPCIYAPTCHIEPCATTPSCFRISRPRTSIVFLENFLGPLFSNLIKTWTVHLNG